MPILDIFWTMLWFFLFISWIWLLISIFGDIFRSDISGWSKAGWSLFVIALPLLGCLVYLIVHGDGMRNRDLATSAAIDQAQRDYIRNVAGSAPSTADEIAKLAQLRDNGTISAEEFASLKGKLLAS